MKVSQNIHVLNGYIAALESELKHHTQRHDEWVASHAEHRLSFVEVHTYEISRITKLIAFYQDGRSKLST